MERVLYLHIYGKGNHITSNILCYREVPSGSSISKSFSREKSPSSVLSNSSISEPRHHQQEEHEQESHQVVPCFSMDDIYMSEQFKDSQIPYIGGVYSQVATRKVESSSIESQATHGQYQVVSADGKGWWHQIWVLRNIILSLNRTNSVDNVVRLIRP